MEDDPRDKDDDEGQPGTDVAGSDPDKVVPAEQTAPGLGEVEVGGESLDP